MTPTPQGTPRCSGRGRRCGSKGGKVMKGFTREETRFSLCGLNCCLCSMHLGGYCPGCGGGSGNQNCAIAKCSLDHGGVLFCWECPEYPCSRYDGFDDGDSFVPHRNRQQDICNLSSGSDAPGASHPGSSSGSPWAWVPSSTVQRPVPWRCFWDLLLSYGSPFCSSSPVRLAKVSIPYHSIAPHYGQPNPIFQIWNLWYNGKNKE